MNIYFLKQDSLYKIFKTLEKTPRGKKIIVHIAHDNQFFDNIRWGKQVYDLCSEQGIDIICILTSQRQVIYCQTCNLPYQMQYTPKIIDFFRMIYLFLFNVKKFHVLLLTKKSRGSFMILLIEIIGLLLLFVFFYTFVVPSTTLSLYPSLQTERFVYNIRYYPHTDTQFPQVTNQLSVPYFTGIASLSYTTQFSLDDFLTTQTPASGRISFVNTTAQSIPLKAKTQLISDEGLIFTTKSFVTIPASQGGDAGTASVFVVADERDGDNVIIGERGNLAINHRLYVRKLTQSFYTKELYAVVASDFAGGSTVVRCEIGSGDVSTLRKRLEDNIFASSDAGIKSRVPADVMLLPRDDTAYTDFFVYKVIDNRLLSGTLTRVLPYRFVWKRDILSVFHNHLEQRRSYLDTIVSVLDNSVVFLEVRDMGFDRFGVTTQISLVRGYNFITDANKIKDDIIQKIRGITVDEAKRIIEGYDEIARVDIVVRPFWYNTISKIQSRIRFDINVP